MTGEDKENPKPREEELLAATEKPRFQSSFKVWIRIVAFVVVAVFLPEQAAQAMEYDWRVLWQKPAVGSVFSPSYLQDTRQLDIPLAVRNILKDISGKPVNAIKISPTLTIELEKPLNISRQRIDEIYNWLKGKPCGSKALYDYLIYEGQMPLAGTVPITEQDVAVMSLTIDILNGVVKPEGDPKVIKNSLYALSRASEFFGHKLYPVKIDLKGQSPSSPDESKGSLGTVPTMPFIAHLKGEHYVLVTKITEDKVYFADEHREEFLPREKFLQDFSGYALIQGQSLSSPDESKGSSGTVPLSDQEAKTILGAGSRRDRGLDAFGLVAGGLLFTQTPISGQSWSTFAPELRHTYAMPKVLDKLGCNRTISNIGGAFLSGAAISGFDFKWNQKAMLNQAVTWGVTSAVQEYGYSQKWDTRLFSGVTNLASNIVGDFAFKKLGGDNFGLYRFGDESRLAYFTGSNLIGHGLPAQIEMSNFQRWQMPQYKDYLAEGLRLYVEDKFSDHGYAKALGSFTSGLVKGGGSARNVFVSAAVSGLASAGLSQLSQEVLPLGRYTGAVFELGLSSALYGGLSRIERGGSAIDLAKQKWQENIQQTIGGFFSGNLATLNSRGNLYYFKPPDASFASTMIDFYRSATGQPNTSWTRENFLGYYGAKQTYEQRLVDPLTGKTTITKLERDFERPESLGFFGALANTYFSAMHYRAVGTITDLTMRRINGISHLRDTQIFGDDLFHLSKGGAGKFLGVNNIPNSLDARWYTVGIQPLSFENWVPHGDFLASGNLLGRDKDYEWDVFYKNTPINFYLGNIGYINTSGQEWMKVRNLGAKEWLTSTGVTPINEGIHELAFGMPAGLKLFLERYLPQFLVPPALIPIVPPRAQVVSTTPTLPETPKPPVTEITINSSNQTIVSAKDFRIGHDLTNNALDFVTPMQAFGANIKYTTPLNWNYQGKSQLIVPLPRYQENRTFDWTLRLQNIAQIELGAGRSLKLSSPSANVKAFREITVPKGKSFEVAALEVGKELPSALRQQLEPLFAKPSWEDKDWDQYQTIINKWQGEYGGLPQDLTRYTLVRATLKDFKFTEEWNNQGERLKSTATFSLGSTAGWRPFGYDSFKSPSNLPQVLQSKISSSLTGISYLKDNQLLPLTLKTVDYFKSQPILRFNESTILLPHTAVSSTFLGGSGSGAPPPARDSGISGALVFDQHWAVWNMDQGSLGAVLEPFSQQQMSVSSAISALGGKYNVYATGPIYNFDKIPQPITELKTAKQISPERAEYKFAQPGPRALVNFDDPQKRLSDFTITKSVFEPRYEEKFQMVKHEIFQVFSNL